MPGVRWADWVPALTSGPRSTKAEQMALQVSAYLRSCSAERVSNRAIKAALGLRDVARSTFGRAMAFVDVEQWSRQGQSFVREGTAAAFGFAAE